MRIALLLSLVIAAAWTLVEATPVQGAAPFGFLGAPSRSQNSAITEANQKGALAKMSDSTKRFVSNTTSVFSPKKKAPVKRTGTTKVIKAKRPEPPKQGFFKSLFYPEPPPPPKTINDWMSLKQMQLY